MVHAAFLSCLVIDEKIVHVGDTIHDVVVIGIQDNAVEFSKAGVAWQQKVLEIPHEAWPSSAKADCPAG